MDKQELIPHLFRTEFSKIASVLCRYFGAGNIELAEDVTSEVFLAALENWPYHGVPDNPTGWLYKVAANKAKNHLLRSQNFRKKISTMKQGFEASEITEPDLSQNNITDSQLRMLFAVCSPSLPQETQIGLALRILCGFGIDEIAAAFLSNRETISKRLFRGREKLRAEKDPLTFPDDHLIPERLDSVLKTLYLLFNEGYYSETGNDIIREALCADAMRLTNLLLSNPSTDAPQTNALLALMCFHASRLPARKGRNGEIILYDQQDEQLWDHELVARGAYYLNRSATGMTLSVYHIEASIAYWHTVKDESSGKWQHILSLYNQLLTVAFSPIAALNRTYAVYRVHGVVAAIREAEKLELDGNRYYHVLLGELYRTTNPGKAVAHLETAASLANAPAERRLIEEKLSMIR